MPPTPLKKLSVVVETTNGNEYAFSYNVNKLTELDHAFKGILPHSVIHLQSQDEEAFAGYFVGAHIVNITVKTVDVT